LKSVLPLQRREGYCWKCRVAGAFGEKEKKCDLWPNIKQNY
jgi:hypothetical protein